MFSHLLFWRNVQVETTALTPNTKMALGAQRTRGKILTLAELLYKCLISWERATELLKEL